MTFNEYKTVEKEVLDCLIDQYLKWRYVQGEDVIAKCREDYYNPNTVRS